MWGLPSADWMKRRPIVHWNCIGPWPNNRRDHTKGNQTHEVCRRLSGSWPCRDLGPCHRTYCHEALDDHGGVWWADPFDCAVWARRVVAGYRDIGAWAWLPGLCD